MSFIDRIFNINQKSYDEVLEEVAMDEALQKRFDDAQIISELQDDIIKNQGLSYNFNPQQAAQTNFASDGSGRGYFFADSSVGKRKFNY